MLDVIVLIAMAVTAVAFAVGLILHSGIAQIPALIAAAALYMVMAASYLMVARSSRPSGGGGDRLNDFEEALDIIDKDLQRIDRVEEEVSRVDLLAERVDRLDRAVSEYSPTAPIGNATPTELTRELEEVHAKIESLRADLEGEAQNQREKMTGDLRMLEGLIKQLSRELILASGAEPAAAAPARSTAAPPPMPETLAVVEEIEFDTVAEPSPEPEPEPESEPPVDLGTFTVVKVEEEEIAEIVSLAEEEPMRGLDDDAPFRDEAPDQAAEPAEAPPAAAPARKPEMRAAAPSALESVGDKVETAPIGESEMLEIMSQAIEAGRLDLYLQPAVTLPERRPRYFEALTRIRTKADKLILPGSYLKVAETSGMMPLVDNVLLVKSVQTLRRLGANSRIKGVFCNISVTTLLDAEFFPELVEFMEENAGLSENLIFEVGQSAILSLNEAELGALDTLGALGFGFSLDHVTDLDIDFVGLRDRFFRFVKIDAKTFLGDMAGPAAPFSAADLRRAVDDFGMQLIVEKVEEESQVARLLDYGVELAQGHLFARPKPMSPALFREIDDADAA